jgi:hypothetical protein
MISDHQHATPRRPRRPDWARLGALVGFIVGLTVAATPVFTHMSSVSSRVMLMALGGIIWVASAVAALRFTRWVRR